MHSRMVEDSESQSPYLAAGPLAVIYNETKSCYKTTLGTTKISNKINDARCRGFQSHPPHQITI